VLDLDDSFRSHPLTVGLKNTLDKFKGYLNTVRDALNGSEVDLSKADGPLKPVLAKLKEVQASVAPEGFDPEELTRLRTELEARDKDPDNKELRQRLEQQAQVQRSQLEQKHANELKKERARIAELEEANNGFETRHRNSVIDRALETAADAASIKPGLRKAFKAQMREECGLEIEEGDDGQPVVRVKSSLGGDTLDAYAKNFTQSDDGKHFVEPAKGGDAGGGDNKRVGKQLPKGNWGGSQDERRAAIRAKFPDLDKRAAAK